MKKITLLIILFAVTFIWFKFQGNIIKRATGNESISDMPPTNFTGADLTGVILGGVSLDGVILCNTTMPDGKINNTSCKN